MAIVNYSEVLGTSNKKLRFWMLVDGVVTAPASLQFVIYDVTNSTNQASPVQVYPGSGRTTVDLVGDYISADKGYVASFTFPSSGNVGLYQIRWFFKRFSTSVEQDFRHEFYVRSA